MFKRRDIALYVFLSATLAIAQTLASAGTVPKKPRSLNHESRLTFSMTSGHGWSVCESYLKSLKKRRTLDIEQLCSLNLDDIHGIEALAWKEESIEENLKKIHQIEVLLGGGRISPAPESDYSLWVTSRAARISSQNQKPRFRTTLASIVPGGRVERILSYEIDSGQCRSEAEKFLHFDPSRTSLGEPNFFILADDGNKVLGSKAWVSEMNGVIGTYAGRSYFFSQYVSREPPTHSFPARLAGEIQVKRFQSTAPISQYRELKLPDDPPYISQAVCVIRFEQDFPSK